MNKNTDTLAELSDHDLLMLCGVMETQITTREEMVGTPNEYADDEGDSPVHLRALLDKLVAVLGERRQT